MFSKVSQKEIDLIFDDWRANDSKAFRYEWYPGEVDMIIFTKNFEGKYSCDGTRSNRDLGILSKEELSKLIAEKKLVYDDKASAYTNYKEKRTGGCNCGVWAVGGKHSDWCNTKKGWIK